MTPARGPRFTSTTMGGALRLAVGFTFFREPPVDLAVDLIAEGGWFGGAAVESSEVLIGPSFHFSPQPASKSFDSTPTASRR